MPENTDQFSAPDPALGYLYQIRCALLWSLKRLKEDATFETSIETLDDVAFESGGSPVELLQTKHHKHRGANLTDASPDLWKTIRIWIAAKDAGEITDETSLYLVTTENAAPGSISANLKSGQRNIEEALHGLDTTAQTSGNLINTTAYEAYLGKSPSERFTGIKNWINIKEYAASITPVILQWNIITLISLNLFIHLFTILCRSGCYWILILKIERQYW